MYWLYSAVMESVSCAVGRLSLSLNWSIAPIPSIVRVFFWLMLCFILN